MSRIPWGVLAAVLVAAALHACAAGVALQYERAAVTAGEPWRLVSGQLVHWSDAMATADLLLVLLVGAIVECHARRTLLVAMGLGVTASALAVHLAARSVEVYRGSSGVGCALLVCAAAVVWRRSGGAVAVVALALLVIKLVAELAGIPLGGTLPAGVQPVPAVHLAGAVAGLLAAVVFPGPRRVEWRSPEGGRKAAGTPGCFFSLDTGPVRPACAGRFPGAS